MTTFLSPIKPLVSSPNFPLGYRSDGSEAMFSPSLLGHLAVAGPSGSRKSKTLRRITQHARSAGFDVRTLSTSEFGGPPMSPTEYALRVHDVCLLVRARSAGVLGGDRTPLLVVLDDLVDPVESGNPLTGSSRHGTPTAVLDCLHEILVRGPQVGVWVVCAFRQPPRRWTYQREWSDIWPRMSRLILGIESVFYGSNGDMTILKLVQ